MNTVIIEGKEYREVTLRGRTKLIARDGSALNPYRRNQKATIRINPDGYPCFGGSVPVHLYVAFGWVDGYFKGAEINHKDFDRQNFNADNLEWVTHAENVAYSVKYNSDLWKRCRQGIHNGRATFTEEKIKQIRMLYEGGMSIADIIRLDHPELKKAKQYKSLHSTYSNICKRRTWKHIT